MRVMSPDELEGPNYDFVTDVEVERGEWVCLHLPGGALVVVSLGGTGNGFHVRVHEDEGNPVVSYGGVSG